MTSPWIYNVERLLNMTITTLLWLYSTECFRHWLSKVCWFWIETLLGPRPKAVSTTRRRRIGNYVEMDVWIDCIFQFFHPFLPLLSILSRLIVKKHWNDSVSCRLVSRDAIKCVKTLARIVGLDDSDFVLSFCLLCRCTRYSCFRFYRATVGASCSCDCWLASILQ